MKKSLLIFIVVATILSCTDDRLAVAPTSDRVSLGSLALTEARTWFSTSGINVNVALGLDKDNPRIAANPDWKNAVFIEKMRLIEVPLKLNSNVSVSVGAKDQKNSTTSRSYFALLLSRGPDGTFASRVVSILSTSSEILRQLSYQALPSLRLTGMIVYHDVHGNFLNGYHYKSGNMIGKTANTAVEDTSNADMLWEVIEHTILWTVTTCTISGCSSYQDTTTYIEHRLVDFVSLPQFYVEFIGTWGGGGSQGSAGEANPGEELEPEELPESEIYGAEMAILCGYIDFEAIGNFYYAEIHGLGMYVKSPEDYQAYSYAMGDVCVAIPSYGKGAYECSDIFITAFNDAVEQVLYYVDSNSIENNEGSVISNLSSELQNNLILMADGNSTLNRQSCYVSAPITTAQWCANN